MAGNYKWEGAPDIQPSLHPLRAEPVINFLKRAFDAEELGRYATPDGVIHHVTMKIGSSHLEMGEAHGPYQPMPGMFYLYVPNCDDVYRRAVAAGGNVDYGADRPSLRRPQRCGAGRIRQRVVDRDAHQGRRDVRQWGRIFGCAPNRFSRARHEPGLG